MQKLLAILTMVLSAAGARAAGDASDILACVSGNMPSGPAISQIEVTTTDSAADGSQTLAGRIFTARKHTSADAGTQLWAMLRIDAPAHLAGAAYLVREIGNRLTDEMFVYLPAVGRVRRITGSFANAPLLGTTFSYFDFKQLWNAFGDLTPAAVHDAQPIEGRPTKLLELRTQPESEIDYDIVSVRIDLETCLPLRAEFKSSGEVVKRFTAPTEAITESDGRWYLSEIHMRDLVDNAESELRVRSLKEMDGSGREYFDPESFHDQD